MKSLFKASLVVGIAAVVGVSGAWEKGDKAPEFSGKTASGKVYSSAAFKKAKQTYVLYFISSTCPVNAVAEKYYNRVFQAYKGKFPIIGVINEDKEGYETWQKRFKAPFPVLLDPDLKIIKAFEAERSPSLVAIGPDGKYSAVWKGYSVGYIEELGKLAAAQTKQKVVKIDTEGAPKTPRFG